MMPPCADLMIKTNNSKRTEKYLNITKEGSYVVFDDIKYKITNAEIIETSKGRVGIFTMSEVIIAK